MPYVITCCKPYA